MFESEDFDLDEDFLKDIGEKEQEYYSQKPEPETTRLTKRRKIESIQSDFLSDISFDDEPDFARITTKSAEPPRETSTSQNSSPRCKSVPEIAESAQSSEWKTASVSERAANRGAFSCVGESSENVKTSRRTLALEILRKGSGGLRHKSETGKNEDSRGTSPLSSFNGDRNSRVSDEQARRRTLLESFKKPAAVAPRVSKSPQKTRFSPRNNRPGGSRVTTLVRKFPGPAGLLPDSPEPRLDDANFLERINDKIAETSELDNEDEISEYFSQNTERLFRSGAWRLMLDDLPSDFLRGHEIATIKRSARNNSRIALLAGVVQRIDHSMENPRLMLKDRTDQIEGTMHRDIPLRHPNVLEPGAVVLLRNVGIIAFQASPNFPSLQFHVMIAPRNVAAVYSDKARLLTSPWMDSILGKRHEPEEPCLTSEDSQEHLDRIIEQTKSSKNSATIEVRERLFTNRACALRVAIAAIHTLIEGATKPIFDKTSSSSHKYQTFQACMNDSLDSKSKVQGRKTRLSFTMFYDENVFTLSQRENRVNVDPSDFESDNETETFARFDLDDLETSPFPASFSTSPKSIESPGSSKKEDTKRKTSPASTTIKMDISPERSSSDLEEKTEAIDVRPKKMASVRSRLAQFRSKDDPRSREDADDAGTSEEREDLRKSTEDSSRDEGDAKSTGFGDNLLDSDNDTEDELLSQLDVDSIVTSYTST